VQTALETGVDHLLDAVGSRNVTQMSSLLQNLVEETITNDAAAYDLDGDVKAALKMIKEVLIGDIRASLDESHCFDQTALQETMHCFEKCEDEKISIRLRVVEVRVVGDVMVGPTKSVGMTSWAFTRSTSELAVVWMLSCATSWMHALLHPRRIAACCRTPPGTAIARTCPRSRK
jgi:hypothetical protein